MYSQNDLDEAVAAGALSVDQANALRAFVEQQRATPAVDEEQFRLITGFNDIFVSIAAAILLFAVGFIGQTVSLYDGIFSDVRIEQRFAAGMPLVRLDVEQMRRVIINLVDNAIEAMDRKGCILLETQRDEVNSLARVIVADDGPGIPPAEREKLFLPYYSTKRRGSGLGLAIVRRIVAEHGGSIDVGDNTPNGTRFTIELPC